MRIFQNPVEMVKEIERDLFEMGIQYQSWTVQDQSVLNNSGYKTIELMGYGYTLKSFTYKDLLPFLKYMDADIDWILAEFVERANPSYVGNPGTAWKKTDRSKMFWSQYLRNDGTFSYTYGERWSQQIPYIIKELNQRENTRQAVMTMYDRHEDMMNWGGMDRVPCSLSYHFMIRDNKLHLIYHQRSCDFVKFFAPDVYFTTNLLNLIATRLEVETGDFIHFIDSLHAFAKDLKGKGIF